ncbi:MAG: hypothetical protein JSS27_18015 [Planctomycetes bacterium]|nr:hypothetical protein [Planctomycetota bacterium]
MDNPYQSPFSSGLAQSQSPAGAIVGRAKQIRIVAVLMIVNAGLLLVMAAILGVMAVFLPPVMADIEKHKQEAREQMQEMKHKELEKIREQARRAGARVEDEEEVPRIKELPDNSAAVPFSQVLPWMYGGVSALAALVAGVNALAGWQNYHYRGRAFGLIALFSNLVTIFTCYCAPTSIALMVYGLVVYLSEDSERAFANNS